MHYPPHVPYYGHFRRGPSRLLWFFLGGAAVAIWQHKRESTHSYFNGGERRFMSWCERRQIKDQPQSQPQPQPQFQPQESYNALTRENQSDPEPLWKLRSEREADQRRLAHEAEFREDMNKAREKMLSVTENGLNSLRQSLESLTKMVQEQRRDRPSRDASPENEKRD